jgi:cullin 1
LQTVHAELVAKAEEELVDSYAEQWRRYVAAAKYNQHLFRFLERHWIQRERDEGKAGIWGIYPLHLA